MIPRARPTRLVAVGALLSLLGSVTASLWVPPGSPGSGPAIAAAQEALPRPTAIGVRPGDRSARVTWSVANRPTGLDALGFRVTPYIDEIAQTPAVVRPSCCVQHADVTGLANDVAVSFTVTTFDRNGDGPTSEQTAEVTPQPWAPFSSADAFTRRQFADFTRRAPTPEERDSWRSALTEGSSDQGDLMFGLVDGPPGSETVAPVIRAYSAAVRTPEPGGLRYWVEELESGRRDLAGVVRAINNSVEFRPEVHGLPLTTLLQVAYGRSLTRRPSASEIAYWEGRVAAGMPRWKVIFHITQGPERGPDATMWVRLVSLGFGMFGDRLRTAPLATASIDLRYGLTTYSEVARDLLLSDRYTL